MPCGISHYDITHPDLSLTNFCPSAVSNGLGGFKVDATNPLCLIFSIPSEIKKTFEITIQARSFDTLFLDNLSIQV